MTAVLSVCASHRRTVSTSICDHFICPLHFNKAEKKTNRKDPPPQKKKHTWRKRNASAFPLSALPPALTQCLALSCANSQTPRGQVWVGLSTVIFMMEKQGSSLDPEPNTRRI